MPRIGPGGLMRAGHALVRTALACLGIGIPLATASCGPEDSELFQGNGPPRSTSGGQDGGGTGGSTAGTGQGGSAGTAGSGTGGTPACAEGELCQGGCVDTKRSVAHCGGCD